MPKIEVKEKSLFHYAGHNYSVQELIDRLPVVKGEVDEVFPETGTLKLEFNDTNRPDLWSTAGAGRALKTYRTGQIPSYGFFSRPEKLLDAGTRVIHVDPALKEIRPYVTAFAVSGRAVDEAALDDLIQTQEKLCWNYGRKRRSIAMGIYRSSLIRFPVQYQAADPDKVRFVPLGMESSLSLREILKKHPKGQEFGWIVEGAPRFPFLADAAGEALSFPPVINSARAGAVEAGDSELFVEMTGTDLPSLILTASMVACDLCDAGFTIHPVKTIYPYDTPFGREITTPYYFQPAVEAEIAFVNKLLGESLAPDDIQKALAKMGVESHTADGRVTVIVPPYRNDFLHPVDIVEDVMIGRGLSTFEPIFPGEFTVGRLAAEEVFARKVRDLMVGLGFQEMIYNYLGSRKDFIEKMSLSGDDVIQILNPMTENYEFVRHSIAPNLLNSEAISGHAIYPHHIFEVGKVAFLDPSENDGTATRNFLGFLSADKDVNFNTINSQIAALFYYLGREYTVKDSTDPRFIPGRCAEVRCSGIKVGVFGEVHPQVLENWSIGVPCTLGEIDLDLLKA